MKRKRAVSRSPSPIYDRIRQILDSARSNVARSVNTTQVITNWLIGREIVEEERRGRSAPAMARRCFRIFRIV